MELNPNHPVTKEVHQQWYKIAALLMFKMGKVSVEITSKEIEEFMNSGTTNIVIKPKDKVIQLWLVDDVQALKLSEEK